MAEQRTMTENVFVREVCQDMLNETLDSMLKLIKYIKVDKTLNGRPGNTVKVTKWGYIGAAKDTAEGEVIDTTKMSFTEGEYTVKKVSKGVVLSSEAIDDGEGDPKGTAIRQLAKAIKDKIESDLFDTAYGAPNIFNGSASAIGYNGIVEAEAMFGDEEMGVEKLIFVHPLQYPSLLKDENFKSRDKFEKSVVPTGVLGKIASTWIQLSNRVRHEDGTQGERTVTIAGTVAIGDVFTILVDGKKYSFKASAATAENVAAGLVAAISADASAKISATNSAGVITLKEKVGEYGIALANAPECRKTSAAGTIALSGTYAGTATYLNPIIKLENENSEVDDGTPAMKVFLKKEAQVHPDYRNADDTWLITAIKRYGTALTNDSKIVVAKYKA